MDPEDVSVGEDYEDDAQFIRWARLPGGHLYRVEGGVPGPWEGPMFPADPNDGRFARLLMGPVNWFFDRAMRGSASPRCYLEVWDVEAAGGEVLVLEEQASDIVEGRARGSELVVQIESGSPPTSAEASADGERP